MKIQGTKLKMTQIWKNNEVIPVSVIKLSRKEELEALKEGDLVKVTGITKGKGFQGVVKRHSFSGGPKTHGQKDRLRAPGSLGATAPQRVHPGRRMAGRMGGDQKTILNLKVVDTNKEEGILLLRGSVPGNNKTKVIIHHD
jgi:large subunit ribosomal protein L3